ncbi:MAG: hypothetical protein IJA12_02345 [Oscillospiraceae bacterium]|nr:hypothetical protein [Oscillospiraceae bacterium]
MKMYFIKKHKRKSKLAIGGGGNGKKILIINLSKDEYINFKNFCDENNYEFKILNIEKEHVVSCEKNVYLLFKCKSIK